MTAGDGRGTAAQRESSGRSRSPAKHDTSTGTGSFERHVVKEIPVIGDSLVLVAGGLIDDIPKRLLTAGLKPAVVVIISDKTVYGHHGERLIKAFAGAGIAKEGSGGPRLLTYAFEPGESSKSRETKAEIEDFMLANRCARDTVVVALGGGVVGDLAGFVAATYMRGVPVVQVPTSTMAMLDSSVGGKTAINVPAGKNLVGAFHQPRLVFADPELLRTLGRREVAEGLAEAIKMGVIRDQALFRLLAAEPRRILDLDAALLQEVLFRAIGHKAEVVALDERELGLRSTLNYGHTIGHAVEALCSPGLLHGECVSIGCVAEAELSCRLGRLPREAVGEVRACMQGYGLPVRPPAGLGLEALMAKMSVDKKNQGGQIRCTVITAVGASLEHPQPVPRE
eukprot:CAMPEP_0168405586 /NCGR_PEP_ID=MMETSP0228-20121227/25216_1 /TAXON_ID=133427 /ORGANISM="Protoceratium reticulatum, Strain CCCM 535 (=CCMP 1889)" /LENGTH=395 /DNA_ID=CAMNT_0008419215 /DNA_START=57 /DNA_END=1241 /DNA_ORIENTATION=+